MLIFNLVIGTLIILFLGFAVVYYKKGKSEKNINGTNTVFEKPILELEEKNIKNEQEIKESQSIAEKYGITLETGVAEDELEGIFEEVLK